MSDFEKESIDRLARIETEIKHLVDLNENLNGKFDFLKRKVNEEMTLFSKRLEVQKADTDRICLYIEKKDVEWSILKKIGVTIGVGLIGVAFALLTSYLQALVW